MNPLFEKAISNYNKFRILTDLGNTLLAKLMSGQIRLKNSKRER